MKLGILIFIALFSEFTLIYITVLLIIAGIEKKKRLLGIIPSLLVGVAILGCGSYLIYAGGLPWWMLTYAAINIIWGLVVLIGGTAYAAFSQDTLRQSSAEREREMQRYMELKEADDNLIDWMDEITGTPCQSTESQV